MTARGRAPGGSIHRTIAALALMFAAATAALFALPSSPALAQPLDPLIRVEVIDGGATARGTHLAGLRLIMAPGWKTYWRSPGDAGIPPQFDWRGSRNLSAVAMSWPAPHTFDQSGLRSIGYKDSVILPVELTPKTASAPIHLKGMIDLGVCKDVCIPAQLDVEAALNPDAPRSSAIAAALAARPYSAAEAGVTSVDCALRPTRDGLQITARIAMPSAGGQEVAVIEPGNPMIWASEADTRRDGAILTTTGELVHANGGAFALDRSRLRLTVLGDRHAVDIRGCTPG